MPSDAPPGEEPERRANFRFLLIKMVLRWTPINKALSWYYRYFLLKLGRNQFFRFCEQRRRQRRHRLPARHHESDLVDGLRLDNRDRADGFRNRQRLDQLFGHDA